MKSNRIFSVLSLLLAIPAAAAALYGGMTAASRPAKLLWSELYKMLPYLVTILVLVLTSMRNKRENQPPESLGVPYFREER